MRNLLIYNGVARETVLFSIECQKDNFEKKGEKCEEVIQNLINTELQISEQISIDRAHRLDRFSTHPIVAKFTYFKDKERVREAAPKKHRDTNIWVKEQYPPRN